ncbi:MAG: hypothetical protein H6765_10505 [Candidatus Peribacteria bacterium]|nr:MAG: hypothetical protein H6765_10505 [Candidatus Peribacteria bacterium]
MAGSVVSYTINGDGFGLDEVVTITDELAGNSIFSGLSINLYAPAGVTGTLISSSATGFVYEVSQDGGIS